MHDASPYAGKTVTLRDDAVEVGGQSAEIVDWYDRTALPPDTRLVKEQDYLTRSGRGDLPADGEILYARVDGMMRIIHVTEIDGYAPPATEATAGPIEARDIGETCPACGQQIRAGQMVAVLILGPGADPDARAKARAGEAYDAAAIDVHWACRTGDESYDNGS